MSKETAVKIKKGEKAATELNQAAERPVRPNPSNREQVHYNVVEAHGVTSPDYTKPQFERKHELAADSEAKAQGAIVAGKKGDGCVEAADPAVDSKARFKAIHKRRAETAATFEALRPTVAGTRKRLGR
jgi:hypothetical protein